MPTIDEKKRVAVLTDANEINSFINEMLVDSELVMKSQNTEESEAPDYSVVVYFTDGTITENELWRGHKIFSNGNNKYIIDDESVKNIDSIIKKD